MSHEKKISAHLLAIFPFGFHGNGHRALHVSPSYPGLAALTVHPTQQSAFHQPSAQNDVPHRTEEEKHSIGDSFKPRPALLPVIMYFCTHLHIQTCSYLCCWHDIFLGSCSGRAQTALPRPRCPRHTRALSFKQYHSSFLMCPLC